MTSNAIELDPQYVRAYEARVRAWCRPRLDLCRPVIRSHIAEADGQTPPSSQRPASSGTIHSRTRVPLVHMASGA
jgi:hypothetical protein